MNSFLIKVHMLILVASIHSIYFAMDTAIIPFAFGQLPVERQETVVNYMNGNSIMSFSKTSHDNHDLVKSLIKRNMTAVYLNQDKDFLFKSPDFLLNNFVPIVLVDYSALQRNLTHKKKVYVDALNPYESFFYFNQPELKLDQKIEKLGKKRLVEALEQKKIQYGKHKVSYNNDAIYGNDQKEIKSNQDLSIIYQSISPTEEYVNEINQSIKASKALNSNSLFLYTYDKLAIEYIKEIPVFQEYIKTRYGEEYYYNI
ncbi:MAG TPA: hypothetical protein VLB80_02580 [Candidatus Babeliales bacterium]|nr:hypothetical protein [Candidatus Babeliales bacterium]